MRKLPLADRLQIVAPCVRDEGTPFCTSCQKVVHDIALLTRDEVLALLRSRSARDGLCVRTLLRKSDGAVLLADGFALPSSRSAPRRAAVAVAAMSAAALAGCAPAPIITVPPSVASPPLGALRSQEVDAERAARGPVPPPLPSPPRPPIEAWLEEEAESADPGEPPLQRKIRAIANREVDAFAGSVVVVEAIPPYWPSWP